MSRGFVKEGDQEEIPIVPPRADLPDSVTNYVTQVGMDELVAEKEMLNKRRENLDISNEVESRVEVNHINSLLQLLNNRIATAQIIDLEKQPLDEVRFGALVTLKVSDLKNLQKYQIVGVDEADIAKGKISFISPIARILINKKVGENAILELEKKDRVFKVVNIKY